MLRIEIEPHSVGDVLAIDGVVACGEVAALLVQRMLADDDATLARLRGVVGDRLVILVGPHEVLPWVDGARYLARAPDEPNLLLPTGVRTRLSGSIVLRALLGRSDAPRPPIVMLPDTRQVVSIVEARSVARARLQSALEAMRG